MGIRTAGFIERALGVSLFAFFVLLIVVASLSLPRISGSARIDPCPAAAEDTKAAEESSAPVAAAPAPSGAPRCTASDAAIEQMQRVLESYTGYRIGWIEIALLLVAATLLIRGVRLASARGGADPVELSISESPEDVKAELLGDIEATLAAMRLQPPPTVPIPQLEKSIGTAISESGIEQVSWFGKLVAAFSDFIQPGGGHKVSLAAWPETSPDKKFIAYRVASAVTGKVLTAGRADGASYHEAAENAAYRIYAAITEPPVVAAEIVPWDRWTARDGSSIRAFNEAQRLGNEEKPDAARAKYAEAIAADRRNAPARLALAGAFEDLAAQDGGEANYIEALAEYLRLLLLWPDHLEARYRLAVVLSSVDRWADVIVSPERLREVGHLLRRVDQSQIGSPRGDNLRTQMLLASARQWTILRDMLRWSASVRRWRQAAPAFRSYHRRLVNPLPGSRLSTYRTIVKAGQIATRIQLGDPREARLATVETNWFREHPDAWTRVLAQEARRVIEWPQRWLAEGWQINYNVACALALAGQELSEPRGREAADAVDQLVDLARDPRADAVAGKRPWVLIDPDLAWLRDQPVFKRFEVILDMAGIDTAAASADEELRYAWTVLADWAGNHSGEWAERITTLATWDGVQSGPLLEWAMQERLVFTALADWAFEPADIQRRTELWGALNPESSDSEPELPLRREASASGAANPSDWEWVALAARDQSTLWLNRAALLASESASQRLSKGDVAEWVAQASAGWRQIADGAEAAM
jgi:hypothetical protein